ncbi:SRPBCC family protein [Aestuariispira insulae]|uniref:Uncharacterized protein YndB with AHSA1/START domain n=1 Tax=Aestuariispira insulae TaxID=1461337 RepID=A0A3D9HXY5_9PROT|nr:SRPBCC domain-containing protein [Aestuariispira insulae]RED54231.1 uncharacterized protein YndB with AHSA1/START domain [Aestuariispira insulae]
MSDAALETDQAPLSLTIERNFKHPVEAVFRAWTETDALRQWMGPTGYSCEDAEMEARAGGRYAFPIKDPEGSIHTAQGEVLAIVPNELLHISWSWKQDDGSQGQQMDVRLEFHPTPNGTRLVLTHSNFIDEAARDNHMGGWSGCLASLEEFLG